MPDLLEKVIIADSRGRVNLGAQAIGKTFTIKKTSDGEFILVPMVLLPEREAWLWQNAEARASFESGVKEAEAGLGKAMDFSTFLETDAVELA